MTRRLLRSTTLLAAMGAGAVLYFAQRAFIPVAIALFLSTLLSPVVDRLQRWHVPRSLAAGCVIAMVAVLAWSAVNAAWDPTRNWLERAPEVIRKIDQRVKPLRTTMARLETITRRASALADTAPTTTPASAAPISPAAAGSMALRVTASLLEWLTVIPLSMFFLTGGPPLLARMASALSGNSATQRTLKLTEAIGTEITRYFTTIALINLGLAIATAIALATLGMPNALLWGALSGVLNFIPYLGPMATIGILTAAALVTFDSLGEALAIPGVFLALHLIEGQLVQPLTVGRRLEMNALSILLAVWFGFWFWGIAGVLLAVPTLLVLKVVAQHEPSWHVVHNFLAPNEGWRPLKTRARKSGG